MGDRARQALAKMALEPEWEARFEPNSYGFRPGRSAQDAIEAIFLAIKHKDKFVLDADIEGCFDHINQEVLLNKLHTYPALRHATKSWLKAGVLEGYEFTATTNGTPQGGVISPLLANIALHGLETRVTQVGQRWEKVLIIRYADDFVLFHSDRTVLEEATREVERFLEEIGLSLHARKTRVTHTLTRYQGNVGFDFLGFTIRQYRVGKTHSGKNTKGRPLGFKTIIKPSRQAIRRHMRAIKQQVKALRTHSQVEVIKVLNPIIRGWAAYYRSVIASEVFQKCDETLFEQLLRWSFVRHHGKGRDYAIKKYWRSDGSRKLVFKTPEDAQVRRHGMTKIERHVKVKGSASPYDGNLRYWSQRLAKHAVHYGKVGALLHRQDGCCCWCGLHFSTEDVIEIDHIDRNRANYSFDNLRALHRHCHDERHASRSKETQERAAGINHT
jgi:RNA-directed DNA polymerase